MKQCNNTGFETALCFNCNGRGCDTCYLNIDQAKNTNNSNSSHGNVTGNGNSNQNGNGIQNGTGNQNGNGKIGSNNYNRIRMPTKPFVNGNHSKNLNAAFDCTDLMGASTRADRIHMPKLEASTVNVSSDDNSNEEGHGDITMTSSVKNKIKKSKKMGYKEYLKISKEDMNNDDYWEDEVSQTKLDYAARKQEFSPKRNSKTGEMMVDHAWSNRISFDSGNGEIPFDTSLLNMRESDSSGRSKITVDSSSSNSKSKSKSDGLGSWEDDTFHKYKKDDKTMYKNTKSNTKAKPNNSNNNNSNSSSSNSSSSNNNNNNNNNNNGSSSNNNNNNNSTSTTSNINSNSNNGGSLFSTYTANHKGDSGRGNGKNGENKENESREIHQNVGKNNVSIIVSVPRGTKLSDVSNYLVRQFGVNIVECSELYQQGDSVYIKLTFSTMANCKKILNGKVFKTGMYYYEHIIKCINSTLKAYDGGINDKFVAQFCKKMSDLRLCNYIWYVCNKKSFINGDNYRKYQEWSNNNNNKNNNNNNNSNSNNNDNICDSMNFNFTENEYEHYNDHFMCRIDHLPKYLEFDSIYFFVLSVIQSPIEKCHVYQSGTFEQYVHITFNNETALDRILNACSGLQLRDKNGSVYKLNVNTLSNKKNKGNNDNSNKNDKEHDDAFNIFGM